MTTDETIEPGGGPSPQLYTAEQAAQRLKVSVSTIWRWIAARRLPAYRIGPRRIRIKPEDLEALIRPANVAIPRERPKGKPADEPGSARNRAPDSPWERYDPVHVRQALRRSAGALADVDRRALLRDLHAARRQGSRTRRA
jgi:excisionase family DNA binding protein